MKIKKLQGSLFAFNCLAITVWQRPVAALDIDVREFGAVCDGNTDDSVAFQAALDALPATGGGTLFVSCRLGLRSGVRISNKSDIVVTGTSSGAGFKALGSKGYNIPAFGPLLFVAERCDRCTIQNLDIEIDGQPVGGIGITGSTEAKIMDNTIRNTGNMSGGAISGSGNIRNQYIGNTILRAGGATRGLWIGNYWDEALDSLPLVANNTVRNVDATGIVVHGIAATIAANLSESNQGAGIKVVPRPLPTGLTTLIEGNNLRNNVFNGLQISQGHDTIIRGNTIELNGGAGIYADAGQFNNILIEQNVLRNNDTDYLTRGWQTGLLIHLGSNIVIRYNVFEDTRSGLGVTQSHGMWLKASQGSITNVRVEQNIFRNNRLNGVQLSGSSPMSNIIVAGNTFVANPEYAVAVAPATGLESLILRDNNVSGSRSDYLGDPSRLVQVQ
jgi:polygalacturonase